MGKILAQKLHESGILAEVLLTREEARDLGGEMENVMVFTEERAKTPSRISLRGRNEATKYFLIPKHLRKTLNTRGSVSCQRMKREDKDVFIYVVHADTERKHYVQIEG